MSLFTCLPLKSQAHWTFTNVHSFFFCFFLNTGTLAPLIIYMPQTLGGQTIEEICVFFNLDLTFLLWFFFLPVQQ